MSDEDGRRNPALRQVRCCPGIFPAASMPVADEGCRLNRRSFGKGSDKKGNGRRNSKKYRILALRKSKKQKKL